MTRDTATFNGMDYPNCAASDPIAMGWMQGTPVPHDKLIRFEDGRALEFPQNRWTLSHMRELLPTTNVWRGTSAASDLGQINSSVEQAIDALTFQDMDGHTRSWAQSLTDTYTDGLLVLHRGKRIYERYAGALQPHGAHACFSITKSYAATLAATLLVEGVLDAHKLIPHYLPEMAHTAYADATLRDLLDMQIGVAYSEDYADPAAQFWDYARAGGFSPRGPQHAGPDSFYAFLLTLKKSGAHGQAFAYKTVNTELLCWVMKRVTGSSLAELLSERIWQKMGCEQDSYLTVDSTGVAFGGGGLNASLRDMARFGEMMRCGGAAQGRQLIPEQVVADIARGSSPAKFAKAGYTLLPGYSYRNMWWVAPPSSGLFAGVFEGRGIHGQRLYIAPQADMVVARFASHPIASSAANDPITLPAFAALGRMLIGA